MDIHIIVALSVLAFFSTNLDNLGMLVVLIAEDTRHAGEVVRGYAISVIAVLALAWILSTAVEFSPDAYIGYLGLIPIALGVYKLVRLFTPGPGPSARRSTHSGTLPVVTMMLAQSGDSLAVYVALLADTRENLEPVILLTLVICGLVWITAARWLATRRLIAEPVEQWGRHILPMVLIAIGALILMDTPTDIQ